VDAKIILNLSKKSVVKNTWQTEKTWDELYAYFEEGYSKYINTVMNPTGD
jgi:hypothetical protein